MVEVAELILKLDVIIAFLSDLFDEVSGILPELPEGPGEIIDTSQRLFMSTPLNDYTVTEGLLLVIVLMLFMGFLFKLWEKVY